MILRPPRSTRSPYTTLFRSHSTCTPPLMARHPRGRGAGRAPLARADRLRSIRRVATGIRTDARRAALERLVDHARSEEHTSELQSRQYIVCRLLLEKTTSPRPSLSWGARRRKRWGWILVSTAIVPPASMLGAAAQSPVCMEEPRGQPRQEPLPPPAL